MGTTMASPQSAPPPERMFLVTFLVLNTADTPRQLDNNIFQASSIAQKHNCQLVGWTSSKRKA